MNILDIVIILLIIFSGVAGLKKGALKSLVNFVGTILVYVISFLLKGKIGIVLCKFFPFFDFEGYPTLSVILYQLIAFIAVASIAFTIFGIIMKLTGIIDRLIDAIVLLKLPSSILGFILGLLEGYIVMFFVVAIFALPLRSTEIYQNSKVADIMLNKSPLLSSSVGKTLSSLNDIFVITRNVKENDKDKVTEVNYKIMDIYIKYHIITKEEALDIIDRGKLDDIPKIKEHVENYNG